MIKNRKIEIRKIENRKSKKKPEQNRKDEKYSKSGPNHGANERLKGEPVAVGDLKASYHKSKVAWFDLDQKVYKTALNSSRSFLAIANVARKFKLQRFLPDQFYYNTEDEHYQIIWSCFASTKNFSKCHTLVLKSLSLASD